MQGWLEGVWAAVPTPFRDDGTLDLSGISGNVLHFSDVLQLQGIYCNGIMGEAWSLDCPERMRILDTTLAAAAGKLRVGVVTTHHSLGETVSLSRHAERAGADHVILTRPRAPLSDPELRDHVLRVAEVVSVPVVLFDGSGSSFSTELIHRLACDDRSIAAVKVASSHARSVKIRAACGDSITITDPLEENWLGNLTRFQLHTLYADPEPYLFQSAGELPIRDYHAAFSRGDTAKAQRIRDRLQPLRDVYNRWIMGPLKRDLSPVAALKVWCEEMGLAAGPVRPPLHPLSDGDRTALRQQLKEAVAASGSGGCSTQTSHLE